MKNQRINREKKIIKSMITGFCHEFHKHEEICSGCLDLLAYAEKRLVNCPFIKNKPVCSNCEIHCYNKNQQEQIKLIMRTMGPKMLFRNPSDTIWYFYYKLIYKHQKVNHNNS